MKLCRAGKTSGECFGVAQKSERSLPVKNERSPQFEKRMDLATIALLGMTEYVKVGGGAKGPT